MNIPFRGILVAGILFLVLVPRLGAEEALFGSKENSHAGLIGIIYDLKQDQKRQPTGVSPTEYPAIIQEFLNKNWDESVLNHYFRSARPLYTTQIFIPVMGAGEAPKAFDVQNVMKPSVWVVHYKGQVSPPEDGTYRFLCYADDAMAVAVNGKTVCEGSRPDMKMQVWKSPEKARGPQAGNGTLVYGDWLELKKDEPVDLDVIVGERPGGQFCAFLMYEKKDAEQVKGSYPIFQLAPYDTPVYDVKRAPAFVKTDKIWTAYQ